MTHYWCAVTNPVATGGHSVSSGGQGTDASGRNGGVEIYSRQAVPKAGGPTSLLA